MHGKLVVHGLGAAPEHQLDTPGVFMAAQAPNVLQYQQWHTLEGDAWFGAAVVWFGASQKEPHC
jgi:hypothetical protein